MEKHPQTINTAMGKISCPICHADNLRSILDIFEIPVLCNVIWENREDALATPRGDVKLVFCPSCGHVFNQAFDPGLLEYDVQYENSLHFSPRFQEYAIRLAHYLIDKYNLHGKNIIEIGSGKGDFLRLLCEYGGNTGVGFDPSYEPGQEDLHPAITFIKDTFSDRYSSYQADFVLSRHVLEHIYQPAEFLQGLRQAIGQRENCSVFFEVPNLSYILRDTAVWDIIYEHYSYFSPSSLSDIFTRYGFDVLHLADAYESQFLTIEARPRPAGIADSPEANLPDIEAFAVQVDNFAARSREKLARWRKQLNELRASRKRAALWGAGSKGISFLNMLGVSEEIEYVIDINPRKLGKFVTGTGQQIVSPEFLKKTPPEVIIVMNPIYLREIQNMVKELDLHVDFRLAS
jgi:hypothetical protein